MDPKDKLAELEKKRAETIAKLKERLKFFHGIRHENSDSEYKYNQIKVLEAHIQSLTEEIAELRQSLGLPKLEPKGIRLGP